MTDPILVLTVTFKTRDRMSWTTKWESSLSGVPRTYLRPLTQHSSLYLRELPCAETREYSLWTKKQTSALTGTVEYREV